MKTRRGRKFELPIVLSVGLLPAHFANTRRNSGVLFFVEHQQGQTRFKKNLLTELITIKQNPFTRSFRYDNVRFVVVKKFPYAAHYTIDEENRIIKIQGVFGFSQDAEANWKTRV